MYNYDDYEKEVNKEPEIEVGKNIWFVDGPIGRLRFSIIMLIILLVVMCLASFKGSILPFMRVCPIPIYHLMIIFLVVGFWIEFVAIAKRLYDIIGSKKWGIITSVILFFINLFLTSIVSILILIMMFIPGKLLKKDF